MDARKPQGRRLSAIILGAIGLSALLGGCAGAIVVFQPFGDRGWNFAGVAALLAWLVLGAPGPGRRAAPAPDLRSPARRAFGLARRVLVGALACWLGLIAWSGLSPGGPWPSPKADPAAIRVLSWNILLGDDGVLPWDRHGWPVRKHAMRAALRAAGPEILCVQEALPGQVKFLEAALPGHRRVGAGRDDGRSAGEHCAIYFDGGRFAALGGGTFWLEEPADEPPGRWAPGPKRICTWVRLRDRRSGRTLRVYNTHLYLTERARLRAARLILARVAAGDPADAVLVAADFNATPDAPSRRLFAAAGLASAAGPAAAPTYQFYGLRLTSIDAILLGRGWRVLGHRVLDVKPGNTFPSDHFGVLVDVLIQNISLNLDL
jgi:endonuclease/exonuclease/phosphatase family metal-dependent hydrolase